MEALNALGECLGLAIVMQRNPSKKGDWPMATRDSALPELVWLPTHAGYGDDPLAQVERLSVLV